MRYILLLLILKVLLTTSISSHNRLVLEWHIPYSCEHHGFVCEMLGYLPALQQLFGEDNVEVTGLGACSPAILEQFVPKERVALETALSAAQRNSGSSSPRRYCRMVTVDGGMEQLCDKDINSNLPQVELDESDIKRVVVSHGDPCAVRGKEDFKNAIAVIARTMTEGKLTDRQIECLKQVNLDELWLPTPWQVEVFKNTGIGWFKQNISANGMEAQEGLIHSPELVYIPETVDGSYYSKHLLNDISDKELKSLSPNPIWNYDSLLRISHKGMPNKEVKQMKREDLFTVVSVFKWGYRKGWDILLEGYWRAFLDFDIPSELAGCISKEEWDPINEVVLQLRTSKPHIGATGLVFESLAGRSAPSEGIAGEVKGFGRHFLSSYIKPSSNQRTELPYMQRKLQWLIHLPPVEVIELPLSKEALRYFVGTADLFALPSRGEGWGLPITEAMALEGSLE